MKDADHSGARTRREMLGRSGGLFALLSLEGATAAGPAVADASTAEAARRVDGSRSG